MTHENDRMGDLVPPPPRRRHDTGPLIANSTAQAADSVPPPSAAVRSGDTVNTGQMNEIADMAPPPPPAPPAGNLITAKATAGLTDLAPTPPLLKVEGVTLQYKTKEHLVTATYRVSCEVLQIRPLRSPGPFGLREVDTAQSRRRIREAGRGQDQSAGQRDYESRARPHHGVPGVRPTVPVEDHQART